MTAPMAALAAATCAPVASAWRTTKSSNFSRLSVAAVIHSLLIAPSAIALSGPRVGVTTENLQHSGQTARTYGADVRIVKLARDYANFHRCDLPPRRYA